MRMALNRKGERRQKNRLMNELYRGEAITREAVTEPASTEQRKSDTKVKCFLNILKALLWLLSPAGVSGWLLLAVSPLRLSGEGRRGTTQVSLP